MELSDVIVRTLDQIRYFFGIPDEFERIIREHQLLVNAQVALYKRGCRR